MQMTPPPPPATAFCHLFHMQMTPLSPPATKLCHLFHMQGRNNSFLKYTDKHRYPTRQNPGRFWNPCWTHFLGLERGPVRVREHVWSPYFSRCQKSSTVSD